MARLYLHDLWVRGVRHILHESYPRILQNNLVLHHSIGEETALLHSQFDCAIYYKNLPLISDKDNYQNITSYFSMPFSLHVPK